LVFLPPTDKGKPRATWGRKAKGPAKAGSLAAKEGKDSPEGLPDSSRQNFRAFLFSTHQPRKELSGGHPALAHKGWVRRCLMENKLSKHRVVTFLSRQELEFLDKLEKDMMFSTGRHLSRAQILQDLAELLARSGMDAAGVRDDAEFEKRILAAMAKMYKEEGGAR